MGIWFNPDGLYRKFGTTKAVPNTGGEFKNYGALRQIEFKLDIASPLLTTTAQVINDVVFFPKGMFLESGQIEVQTAVATSTSVSVGMVQSNDRTTAIGTADIGVINAAALATLTPAGTVLELKVPVGTPVGNLFGTVPISSAAAFTGMFTAKIAGGAGTGILIIRLNYRAVL